MKINKNRILAELASSCAHIWIGQEIAIFLPEDTVGLRVDTRRRTLSRGCWDRARIAR